MAPVLQVDQVRRSPSISPAVVEVQEWPCIVTERVVAQRTPATSVRASRHRQADDIPTTSLREECMHPSSNRTCRIRGKLLTRRLEATGTTRLKTAEWLKVLLASTKKVSSPLRKGRLPVPSRATMGPPSCRMSSSPVLGPT
jgi:hypothetical protein